MAVDHWHDRDADSGLRLALWLTESQTRDVQFLRVDDWARGAVWHVTLIDERLQVASGRARDLHDAWGIALDRFANDTDTQTEERNRNVK